MSIIKLFRVVLFSVLYGVFGANLAIAESAHANIPSLVEQQGFINTAKDHANMGLSAARTGDFDAARTHVKAAYKSAKKVSSQGGIGSGVSVGGLMNRASTHIRQASKAAKDQDAAGFETHVATALNGWNQVNLIEPMRCKHRNCRADGEGL